MKKKIVSVIVVLCIMVSFMPASIVYAGNYGNISEEDFVNKIASLKSTFVHGKYWNRYNGLEHTGNTSCPCGYSTCPGDDDCKCGAFYYDGNYIAGQCHGYALMIGNKIFGGNPNNWGKIYNANNVYAGDIARLDSNGHSIFIYKVDGNDIYYTDCNAIGRCMVNWNGYMTKSTLSKRLSWIYHLSGNTLTGKVSKPNPPIHKDNNPHVRNGFFTFKNVSSGTFMNVWGGDDRNKTEITTYSFDDSIDQRFNVVHKGNGQYKIYAECSDDGRNRVVDIFRNGASLDEGQLVDLYDPNDDTAQLFYIVPLDDNTYVFETAKKDGYIIAPPNAGLAGSNTKNSQLRLQKYTGQSYQKWKLCNNNGKETAANVSYAPGSYKVETNGDWLNMRKGAHTGYDPVGSIPDQTTLRVTQVNNNWGYTSYNGTNGWVCLDFTVYTVTADSISVTKKPDKTAYFVGDSFDSTGLEISVNYSNGQKELIGAGFSTSCDLSSAGTKTVNVSYKGSSTSFTVEVKDLAVNNISLYSTEIQTEYNVGETLIIDELGLLVDYDNGNETLVKSGFDVDYDFSTPGTKTVSVSYGGKSISYEVEVLASVDEESAAVGIGSVTASAGASVTVPVTLTAQGIYDGNMTIQYDSTKLKIESVEASGALAGRQTTINKDFAADKIRVTFAGTEAISGSGEILKLKFKALPNAQGSAAVSVMSVNMYNVSGKSIAAAVSNGSVQISTAVSSSDVSNIQSSSKNGKKVVTANVSDDNVKCYLAVYQNNRLIGCGTANPQNGSVEVSVSETAGAQYKFMVLNTALKPMINAVNIY